MKKNMKSTELQSSIDRERLSGVLDSGLSVKKVQLYDKMTHLLSSAQNSIRQIQSSMEISIEQDEDLTQSKSRSQTKNLLSGIFAIDASLNNLVQAETRTHNQLSHALKNVVHHYKFCGNLFIGIEGEEYSIEEKKKGFLNLGDLIKVTIDMISNLSFSNHKSIEACKKIMKEEFNIQQFMTERKLLISSVYEENVTLKKELARLKQTPIRKDNQRNSVEKSIDNSINKSISKMSHVLGKNLAVKERTQLHHERRNISNENSLLKSYQDIDSLEMMEKMKREIRKLKNQQRNDEEVIVELNRKINEMEKRQDMFEKSNERNTMGIGDFQKYRIFHYTPFQGSKQQSNQTLQRPTTELREMRRKNTMNSKPEFISPTHRMNYFDKNQHSKKYHEDFSTPLRRKLPFT